MSELGERLPTEGLPAFVAAARAAAAADIWFAALPLALTLPDICASIDDPGRGKSRARYIRWWDEYAAAGFIVRPDPGEDWEAHTYIPGKDAFALRNAYLHAGTDELENPDRLMNRIRFVGPPAMWRFGLNEETRTLNVSMEYLVEVVCAGVESWMADRAKDPVAQQRLTGLVSIIPSAIRYPQRRTQP